MTTGPSSVPGRKVGTTDGLIRVSFPFVQAQSLALTNLLHAGWRPEQAVYSCLEIEDDGYGIAASQSQLSPVTGTELY